MQGSFGRYAHHFLHTARTALVGPQILAFVPALTLGGYWYGGEGVLLFMAILLPALLGLVGIFTPMRPAPAHKGPVDAVTGLPMREAVVLSLDRGFCKEPETGLRCAALVFEIDDFAQVRSQLGDTAADRVLVQVGERAEGTMRTGDVTARLGGATFGVALAPQRRCDLEALIQIAARIQAAVAEPLVVDGLRLFLTASVGFCVPRRATEKSGTICLEAAETALAEAQASGVAAIRAYAAQPRRKKIRRTGLVGEVAEALDSGQIRPWFQPQLSTDDGTVSGLEALARWEHPERGVILPGAFLPAIAAAGMAERLGEVILYQSLSTMRALDEGGTPVPRVAVNFSGDELADPKLPDKIRWELDRFDLAPDRLTIEILETVIARSANDSIVRTIAGLAELGCGVDLDDFGTGHASIANIRRFSVGRIKIDRSFVTCIDTDRQQQQMLTAILEMADRMEVETLAEGVETVAEHALLAQLGCGHVQGFSIAQPMPAEHLADWLEGHRRKLDNTPRVTKETG